MLECRNLSAALWPTSGEGLRRRGQIETPGEGLYTIILKSILGIALQVQRQSFYLGKWVDISTRPQRLRESYLLGHSSLLARIQLQ